MDESEDGLTRIVALWRLEAEVRTHALQSVISNEINFFYDYLDREIWSQLYNASEKGDLNEVNRLLEVDGMEVDSKTPDPLDVASEISYFATAERLIEATRNICSDEKFFSAEALDAAVEDGQQDEVARLKKNKEKIRAVEGPRTYLLGLAAEQNDFRTVKILLDAGTDVNSRDYENTDSAIGRAARAGNLEIVEYLLHKGADVNKGRIKSLQHGSASGNVEVVKRLIQAGADLDEDALPGAAEGAHIEIVQLLINTFGAVDERGKGRIVFQNERPRLVDHTFSALSRAAKKGHTEVVNLLLKSLRGEKLPLNVGRLALWAAAEGGSLEIVKVLLAVGADSAKPPGAYGFSPLQCAAKCGNLDMLNVLLDAGCELEETQAVSYMDKIALSVAAEYGHLHILKRILEKLNVIDSVIPSAETHCYRALYAATEKGRVDIVRHLLELKTPVNGEILAYQASYSRNDLLACAIRAGDFDTVKLLVEAKVDLERAYSSHAPSPLQTAVGMQRLDLVEFLLSSGVNVDAANGPTSPSIHIAAAKGNIDLVNILLNAGADITVLDYNGRSAIQAAEVKGNAQVVTLLKSKQEELAVAAASSLEKTWEIVEKPIVAEETSLCLICEKSLFNIFHREAEDIDGHHWHTSLTSLEASVVAGCIFCAFFRKQLGTGVSTLPQTSRPSLYHQSYDGQIGHMSTQITEPYPRDVERPRELCTSFCFNIEPFEGKRKTLAGSTSSPQTFQQIRSWMNICNEGHNQCRRLVGSESLPEKLIDLDTSKDSKTIKVIKTEELSAKDTRYVTLSHDQNESRLDSEIQTNLELGEMIIPINKLPPLFAHSIQVTRELGIKYLWIDSLCHTSEMRTEGIYMNSYCTIAAATTPNTKNGLFRSIPTDGLSVEFECKSKKGEKRKVQAMRQQQSWMPQYKAGPLSTNIRSLLERELSPRVIHFTESEVLWECRTLKAMESWPGENMPRGWPHPEPRILDLFAGSGDRDGLDIWHQAVAQFTERPVQGDNGLSEVAAALGQVFESKVGGRYIAGIWEKDLRRSLAWVHHGFTEQIPKRYAKYLGPTWSWASVHGPLWYEPLKMGNEHPNLEPDFSPTAGAFTITSLNLVLSSPENKFSPLVLAELHIRTPILHGILGYDASHDYFGQMIMLNNAKGDQNYGDLYLDVPSERKDMGLQSVSIIYLGIEKSCKSYTSGHKDGGYKGFGCCGLGLAIVPVKGKKGVYQRVGLVNGIPAKNFIGQKCVDIALV